MAPPSGRVLQGFARYRRATVPLPMAAAPLRLRLRALTPAGARRQLLKQSLYLRYKNGRLRYPNLKVTGMITLANTGSPSSVAGINLGSK